VHVNVNVTMELEGSPSAHAIRSLILNSQITEPILFKEIHRDWIPVKWDLEKMGKILSADEGQLLPCRIGKIHHASQVISIHHIHILRSPFNLKLTFFFFWFCLIGGYVGSTMGI